MLTGHSVSGATHEHLLTQRTRQIAPHGSHYPALSPAKVTDKLQTSTIGILTHWLVHTLTSLRGFVTPQEELACLVC